MADVNVCLAAAYGCEILIDLLLQPKRPDFSSNSRVGTRTALVFAIESGSYKTVNKLLEYGAEINVPCPLLSPLCEAVDKGHIKIVELLLKRGADVNAIRGRALRRAAMFGHTKIVELLIRYGAYDVINTRCTSSSYSESKDTSAICLAAGFGHLDIVMLLYKNGADMCAALNRDLNALNLIYPKLTEKEKDNAYRLLLYPLQRNHSIHVIERAWLEYAYQPGNVGFRRCLKSWTMNNS